MKCLPFLTGNETICSVLIFEKQWFTFTLSHYSDIAHIFRDSRSHTFSLDTLLLSGMLTAGEISPAVHLIEPFVSFCTLGVNPVSGEAELCTR